MFHVFTFLHRHTHKLNLSEKLSEVHIFDKSFDSVKTLCHHIMPSSFDEAPRRDECCVKKIQDSIFVLEALTDVSL